MLNWWRVFPLATILLETMVWEFGSDIKLQVKVSGNGFNQSKDLYDIDIYNGENVLHFSSSNLVGDGNGNYYLPIKAEQVIPGPLVMIVTGYIPDTDFSGKVRRDVAPPIKLGMVKESPVNTK